MTTLWRSDLTPVHKSTSEPGEAPRYLICALLETLPDLELFAAVAHRRRRAAALMPPLDGEAVARRRERACPQRIDGEEQ